MEISLAQFIEPDHQHELLIIKIIKEMKDVSMKFNLKVDNYNKLHPKQKVAPLDPISFNGMEDFEKILKAEAAHDMSIVIDDQFDAA